MGGYTVDQARELAMLSAASGRQIGLLLDRQGRPEMVIVGDAHSILIPELGRERAAGGRLRGLRLLHTHLTDSGLSEEDLTDMLFLRLDSVTALAVDKLGQPQALHVAHLLPPNPEKRSWEVLPPRRWDRLDLDFKAMAESLEDELARGVEAKAVAGEERALLVSVSTDSRGVQEASLKELAELARTAGLTVMGRVTQRVRQMNPKTVLGKGKIAELEVQALQQDAQVLVFDRELTPAQQRTLADVTERKVLDRTQLILDIFAQRATSRSGKLQVEMAQLKYLQPRLVGQNRALSRLAGGIGGRGPGETKLEIDRRRVRERVTRIKNELEDLRRRRGYTRERRAKSGVPVVALVGYTNAGKSTLLNTLTGSVVLAEDKLFATLDPTSRRIRFPREREVVLTDTVGFIRQLPDELKEAFRATLEELESADLLVHVADAGSPELESQVAAVESILDEMELGNIARVLVLNKWDTLAEDERQSVRNLYPEGIPAVAKDRSSLEPLVEAILNRLPENVDADLTPDDLQ